METRIELIIFACAPAPYWKWRLEIDGIEQARSSNVYVTRNQCIQHAALVGINGRIADVVEQDDDDDSKRTVLFNLSHKSYADLLLLLANDFHAPTD